MSIIPRGTIYLYYMFSHGNPSTVCHLNVTYQRCSNYIFIPDLTPGSNGLGKDNCKTRRDISKFWDLVRPLWGVWRWLVFANMSCQSPRDCLGLLECPRLWLGVNFLSGPIVGFMGYISMSRADTPHLYCTDTEYFYKYLFQYMSFIMFKKAIVSRGIITLFHILGSRSFPITCND